MLVVGLTGGIASGKSTVSKLLSDRHHIPIIDADLLAREVIAPGTSGYDLVVSHFGPDRVLQDDGVTLNRSAIGDIVFRDGEQRKWLNGVVHPRVRREMARSILRYWLKGEWCVIVDVPLLIEAGMWKWVGDIVVVYVNERLQLSRLLARHADDTPPLTQTQAQNRIASQLALSSKLNYATSVIDNSGSFTDLTDQVDRTVAKWKKQQGGSSGWWWRVCWLLPPVGLVAGALCLFATWRNGTRKSRRRGRGEVNSRAGKGDQTTERIELMEMRGGRRRAASGSITDED
ncbi:dephospho-CoA kinase [Cryptococcus amylolentus CBS 6039]|uniref:Dephospho-CoA kinase n=1 Tax=Cryptococcus amylolentus CBS 6039 TaxID=1295533 RepID=A0A1E3I6T5_9TREE|nr:dephospho-CoA kinase [Cryptococcus amylolentus CBS 6039]ODN84324.1 dephospho-CoA kinase [Cryptococcus amylolentus CBS 6039]